MMIIFCILAYLLIGVITTIILQVVSPAEDSDAIATGFVIVLLWPVLFVVALILAMGWCVIKVANKIRAVLIEKKIIKG